MIVAMCLEPRKEVEVRLYHLVECVLLGMRRGSQQIE